MRLLAYGAVSSLLTAAALYSAYSAHQQFYPMLIYLSRSSASVVALLNFVIFLAVLFGRMVQLVFFGQLRVIEVEHLYERIWFTISETFLAMTVFRDEFNSRFLIQLTLMLMSKCFHWLQEDRIDFMELTPNMERGFHFRAVGMMISLALTDLIMVSYSFHSLSKSGPSMQLMFGFEYLIMMCALASMAVKYLLHLVDHQRPLENKSIYMFYLELVVDFCRLSLYLCFFAIILNFYGLPIHIIRDLYLTMRSFVNRLRDLVQYRRATANMDQRYPDATAEELSGSDKTCIICREEMELGANQPKKLPCGHLFHLRCLRSWLERQQSCPTCRRSVLQEEESRNSANNAAPAVPPPAQPAAAAGAAALPALQGLGAVLGAQPQQQPLTAGPQLLAQQAPVPPHPPTAVNNNQAPIISPFIQLIPLVPPPMLPPQPQQQQNRWPNFQIPTTDFQQLSDAELIRLTGQGRQQMIERIQMLQRLQEDISAVLVKSVQYLSVLDDVTTNSNTAGVSEQERQSNNTALSESSPSSSTAKGKGSAVAEGNSDFSPASSTSSSSYSASATAAGNLHNGDTPANQSNSTSSSSSQS